MASTNKKAEAAHAAEFADEFNKSDASASTGGAAPSDFPPGSDGEPDDSGAASASAPDDAAAGAVPAGAAAPDPAAGEAAPGGAKNEQQLKSWEGRLKAKEKELADKEALMASGQRAGDDQSGKTKGNDTDNGDGGGDDSGNDTGSPDSAGNQKDPDGDDDSDPAAALAADFGDDFVTNITALIKQVMGKGGSDKADGVAQTLDQLISELRTERQQNHFKAIAATHSDFIDVTNSQEFKDWINGLSSEDQASAKQVIDAGSADQIVALLSKYKSSLNSDDGGSSDDDDGSDAAESVRSTGLRLPASPSGGSDDYAAAWNEA